MFKIGPHGTGPHGTGPHGTGPHGTGPHGTGPHGTGPHGRHWAENFRDGAASGPSCHTPLCYLLRGTAALARSESGTNSRAMRHVLVRPRLSVLNPDGRGLFARI